MILYTGGKYQGKLNIVLEKYNLPNKDVLFLSEFSEKIKNLSEDISTLTDSLKEYSVWYETEELVRKLAVEGWDKNRIVDFIVSLHNDIKPQYIIICETGCGVIPIDDNERVFREACGELSTIFAKDAEMVYRVICGIDVRLK